MKIAIASDHRGYMLKEELINYFNKQYEIIDLGTNSNDSVDYPDYAFKLCSNIIKNKIDFGIAICGSGIGISIACNKVNGIRCAKVNSISDAIMTRKDNDSNVVALSANISPKRAKKIVEKFIITDFSNEERHIRRINKIKEYELNR